MSSNLQDLYEVITTQKRSKERDGRKVRLVLGDSSYIELEMHDGHKTFSVTSYDNRNGNVAQIDSCDTILMQHLADFFLNAREDIYCAIEMERQKAVEES